MTRNIIAAVLLVALGAFAAVFVLKSGKPKDGMACTLEAKLCPDGSSVGRTGPFCEFAECPQPEEAGVQEKYVWTFKDKGTKGDANAPQTEVTLAYSGGVRTIGTFEGTCAAIDRSEWQLLPGEKSGVICWFAGGGEEIGVFEGKDSLVVKVGTVEEGDAETPGGRSNFKTILSL
jgi:hypothetical protein